MRAYAAFSGPRSVAGEDVAELHVHGSRAVAAALSDGPGHKPGCGWPSPASSPAAPSSTASSI